MTVATNPLDELDRKILCLLFEGKTAKQIGESVFISSRTVEGRLKKIRDLYDCKNNVQLAAKFNLQTFGKY